LNYSLQFARPVLPPSLLFSSFSSLLLSSSCSLFFLLLAQPKAAREREMPRDWEGERDLRNGERDVERETERDQEIGRGSRTQELGPVDPWAQGAPILHDRRLGLKSGDGGASAELRGSNPQPVSPENPRPASQTRRIRENPCDPILPEVRSSMSGGSSGGFRWAVTCVQQPRRRPEAFDPKPDPVARQTREEDPVLPVRFPVDFLIKSSRYKNPMIKFNLLNLLL
jgi:hypothetical protein